MIFLLFDEFLETVKLFLYLSKCSRVYLLKFFFYSKLVLLEQFYFVEYFQAFTTAIVHEDICCSTPIVTLDTWLNLII